MSETAVHDDLETHDQRWVPWIGLAVTALIITAAVVLPLIFD